MTFQVCGPSESLFYLNMLSAYSPTACQSAQVRLDRFMDTTHIYIPFSAKSGMEQYFSSKVCNLQIYIVCLGTQSRVASNCCPGRSVIPYHDPPWSRITGLSSYRLGAKLCTACSRLIVGRLGVTILRKPSCQPAIWPHESPGRPILWASRFPRLVSSDASRGSVLSADGVE